MIVLITGEHDAGKTSAALGYIHPKKVAFFHDDVKDPPGKLSDYGYFVDLVSKCKGMKLFDFRSFVLERISEIPQGTQGIVFDTWTRFGEAIRNYVNAHSNEFRNSNEFIMKHKVNIVGAQKWKDAHRIEAEIISSLAQKAPYVCLVSHLKDYYIGETVVSNKQIPDIGKCFNRICNLRLWLRHNEESGVPIALVLKRLSASKVTKKGLQVVNVLPRRIKPLQNEQSIWEAIERYKKEPYGNRLPTPDETPTPYELSILDSILTEDQKEVWRANLKASKEEEAFFEDTKEDEAKELARKLSDEGLNILKIVERLKEEYPNNGYDVGKVGQLLVKG